MKHTILVIEDETLQLQTLTGFLEKQGYDVIWSTSGTEGLKMAQKQPVDLILTDYKMPGKNGLEVLREARTANPETAVVLITAHGTEEIAVQAMKEGAFDYLSKPIDLEELEIVVKKVLEQKQLVSENQELRRQLAERYHFHEIISGSAEMEEVINLAGRAARSRTTVLIQGESGTGKELIARAIHYASSRKDAPFVAVNCAALSENLLESELFGHERGAFTGADRQRKGRFEQADGGTLFIDEVGDIPVGAQVKLLRVLQEQRFERVGGNEALQVDVRVIAATNRNLEEMMQKGSFREDLFYRLNVISISIPPLRRRRDDIPPLVSHFIHKYAAENDKEIEGVSREAMDILIKYDYPGNVRELGNAIERAIVMARGTIIVSEDLPIHLRSARSERESSYEFRGRSLPETLEDLERHLITDALAKTGGNQSKAAEKLGISERNLRYRIKKYSIRT